MKNFIVAVAISIIIHFILLVGFKNTNTNNTQTSKVSTPKYTQVKLVKIKEPIKKKQKIVKKDIKIDKRKKTIFTKSIDKYKEQKEVQKLDKITQQYIKLYGEEYFNFSKETKKFLKENLNEIGKITQQYIRYPSIAIKTKQEGTNVVEFILKSNGDITNLRIIGSSDYSVLDKNTLKTIKIAYKDYPKPKKDTPIKIFVLYSLY